MVPHRLHWAATVGTVCQSSCIARSALLAAALTLPLAGCTPTHTHGNVTGLSMASNKDWKACEHDVPEDACVRCHPELSAKFKQRNDWCAEHDVPESQCLACHPDLDFSPPEEPPAGSDVAHLAKGGADVPALEPHVAIGKATVFDFHAAWCTACRKVDSVVYAAIRRGTDIAVRKIDIGSWDTPVAEHWLAEVPELPYLVIYDKDGKRLTAISGAKLDEIDAALEEASR